MARPTTRSRSTKGQFKKRVPSDVLARARGQEIFFSLPKALSGDERFVVRAKFGTHVEFSLRTNDPALINLRHGAALEQFERGCAAHRQGPQGLTHKQRIALAGILYRDLKELFEDDPVDANWWRIVAEVAEWVLVPPPGPPLMIEAYPGEAQIIELERYVGPFLNPILSRHGIIPAAEERPALLRIFAKALIDAAKTLKRFAEGDYTPDDAVTAKYPKWDGAQPKAPPAPSLSSSALTAAKLFALWHGHPDQKAVKPSTLASYAPIFEKLTAFLTDRYGREPSAAELGREDFRAFIDMRSTVDGVSAKTINDTDLAGINAVFNWAVDQDLLASNPANRVKRKVRKGAENSNKRRKTLNDAEALAILRHALSAASGSSRANRKLAAAKRWVPWLMAYTGTRVGEMAQLRKCDVSIYDGHPAISITGDAGTVKTDGMWHVPLHPHLIEQGFLDFVDAADDGTPLSYAAS
ncbi:hypothetical protein [Hyphomicrobium sp. D-2]|uniref:tyrosine-type recombinase/integrase n=1 Tax=Hyphomicrobium sp. D-2 TaxID=3041621 RepID=UPI002458E0E0|nr:hypothetical protein [Hyphomicrobium sp. D-2]MDH4981880.1 hypothetical protein [Hyphomicrobium sp. D-2]